MITRVIKAIVPLMAVLALTCVNAVPTAPPAPSPTQMPSPAPTFTPSFTPASTPAPAPTPTATPTPTPTPIPTQIPGRTDLYETVFPPEHMAYVWWYWDNSEDDFRELEVEFTIHNDPGDFSNRHGLYLMVCQGSISGRAFYFGLQTNVQDVTSGRRRGKGLIFSRWDERNLSFAKVAGNEDGWAQSSGHEGNFIGVRRSYDWTAGDYRMRLAPDGKDDDGEWYGVWITDLATDITTWAGSLKFPLVNGTTVVSAPTYTTLEIYGNPIRPIDIPEWHVSVQRPIGNGIRSTWGNSGYSGFMREIHNSDVQYDPETDSMHFRVGGATERVGSTQLIQFQ